MRARERTACPFQGCEALSLTNSILWWQVDGVCVEVLQKGSVHQVGELVDFYGVLVSFIQQCTKVLTPEMISIEQLC